MMSKRLNAVYQLIPKNGKGVIDVGTDHGQIPIMLALSAYPGNIFASDIHDAPLRVAISSAEMNGVSYRIHFFLADGLECCPPDQISCIVIAGMGGDTICTILDQAEWLFSSAYRLVLQPMTRPEVVRYWLIHNEFLIDREVCVREGDQLYQILSAVPGRSSRYRDADYLVGRAETHQNPECFQQLLESQIQSVQKKLDGMMLSGRQAESTFAFYQRILCELEETRHE